MGSSGIWQTKFTLLSRVKEGTIPPWGNKTELRVMSQNGELCSGDTVGNQEPMLNVMSAHVLGTACLTLLPPQI